MKQHHDPTRTPSADLGAPTPAHHAGMRSKGQLTAAIRQHRRAALVVNTRSRRGHRLYPRVRAQLTAAGFTLLGSFPVHRPQQLSTSLAAALDLHPDLVILGGGDGSISTAVRHLAHRDIALGILPLGTTNNFARTLAIPLTLPAAITVLTHGKVADVDLGHVGDTPFANLVSLGVSAEVAAHAPTTLKRVLGRAAYPLTAAVRLPRHPPFRARLTVDNRHYHLHTHQLNIANGSFHAGRPITGDASADDRLLLVYPLGGSRRRELITAVIRHTLTGRRRALSDPAFLAVDDLWLHTDPPLPLDIDGEIRDHTPTRITLVPEALRVMVATDFPDT